MKDSFDRFIKITADRRAADKRNAAASGISETHCEKKQLLDDIIAQMKEWKENERVHKEEKSEKEKKIQDSVEEIRDRALKRQRKHKARTFSTVGSSTESDAEMRMIVKKVETHKLAREAMQRIEEERLDLERKRVEREEIREKNGEERETPRMRIDERRTGLGERRFQADIEARRDNQEEHRSALEERKSLIVVLGSSVKKLDACRR